MADIFFLYYEEHDWAAHIKKAGYSTYYNGKSLIYHKESISTGKDSPFKTYYLTRGRILFARRNTSGLKKILSLLYIYFITTPRITLEYLFKLNLTMYGPTGELFGGTFLIEVEIFFELPKLKQK